jgi:hypothetical protein
VGSVNLGRFLGRLGGISKNNSDGVPRCCPGLSLRPVVDSIARLFADYCGTETQVSFQEAPPREMGPVIVSGLA